MDIALHYIEAGSGEPLILLHGNGESSAYFEHQISYFSKRYRVIAVDTRGHGASPRGTAPFTIRQFAQDLYEFMEARRIVRANLLGFSDGGNIALVFALRYPSRVKRLVLNGANLYGGGVKAHIQLPIILGYRIASLFSSVSSEAKKNAELLGLMVNDPNIKPEALHGLSVRTLLITGDRDMIKDSHTKRMLEALPDAEWVRLHGDHFIANKEPEAFNRAVEQFLEKD